MPLVELQEVDLPDFLEIQVESAARQREAGVLRAWPLHLYAPWQGRCQKYQDQGRCSVHVHGQKGVQICVPEAPFPASWFAWPLYGMHSEGWLRGGR